MRVTASTVLAFVVLALLAFAAPGFSESTKSCSGGKTDVLDWMTLDSDLRSSKHMTGSHPIYTLLWSDKYWWIKSSSGDTWDVNLYDGSWIYLWVTEKAWGTPYDYKRHYQNTNVKLAPRCASPGLPGERQFISDTGYRIANSCQEGSVLNLNKGLTEFWGPYTAGQPGLESSRPRIGGDIPDSTTV